MAAFFTISILLGILSLFYAYLLTFTSCKNPRWYRNFPRLKLPGLILGSICLIWAARHTLVMLEGDLVRFHIYVKLLVPVAIVLCYFFLDYLNARALGGFMILSANYLLHAAFAYALAGRAFFAIVCLLLGVSGLFLVGTPWRMRQVFELANKNRNYALIAAAVFLICASSLILQPLLIL